MPTLTAKDGTQLFCRRWGDGPPVMLSHGWAMSSDAWQPLMLRLSEAGFSAIAYDRRGSGRSDDPGRGYDYDTLADDLDAVMAAFDVEDATMVGHSMGCGEIVRRITRHGARGVARIVMIAPFLPFPLKTADNPDGHVDGAQATAMRAAWVSDFAGWLGLAVPPAFPPETPPEQLAQVMRSFLQTSVQAAIATNVTGAGTDMRGELATLNVPTLILHGDADTSSPLEATGRRTAALIPGATLKVYPGAQHSLVLTHADALAADIVSFARGKQALAA
jgi:pimeloyl-ACP methyl ester carboxylesterase